MSKWEKAIARLKQTPDNIRYHDLEVILLRIGFVKRQTGGSHVVFTYASYRITLPIPHGSPFMKEVYIKKYILPMLEDLGLIEDD